MDAFYSDYTHRLYYYTHYYFTLAFYSDYTHRLYYYTHDYSDYHKILAEVNLLDPVPIFVHTTAQ